MRVLNAPYSNHPKVKLRQIERTDIQDWYNYLSKGEVVRYTTWRVLKPQDLIPQFDNFESLSKNSDIRLAIVLEESQAVIGTIGFVCINELHCNAEIAFDLDSDYWNQGILSSICATVVQWAFAEYGFERIQALVIEGNIASEKVLLNSGFKFEGVLRNFRIVRGELRNVSIFSCLANH